MTVSPSHLKSGGIPALCSFVYLVGTWQFAIRQSNGSLGGFFSAGFLVILALALAWMIQKKRLAGFGLLTGMILALVVNLFVLG